MMARQTKQPELKEANLSFQQMEAAIPAIDRRIAELNEFEPGRINDRRDPRVSAISSKLDDLLVSTFGHDSVEYKRYRSITTVDTAPYNYVHPTPIQEVRQGLTHGIARARTQLEGIKSLFL